MLISAEKLLVDGQIREGLVYEVEDSGRIETVWKADEIQHNHIYLKDRLLAPGMVNAHSHAFQRAMAGMSEQRGPLLGNEHDNFWTWRNLMFRR